MFKKLLLCLVVSTPTLVQAEWIQVLQGSEFTTYLDADRMVKTNESLGYAEAWAKQVVHTDLSKDGLSVGDHRLFKYAFRCNSGQIALIETHSYKGSKNLDSYRARTRDYDSIIPESNGEYLFNLVCDILYPTEQ